jgi:hypothetical protein
VKIGKKFYYHKSTTFTRMWCGINWCSLRAVVKVLRCVVIWCDTGSQASGLWQISPLSHVCFTWHYAHISLLNNIYKRLKIHCLICPFVSILLLIMNSISRYSDSLRAGRSEDRIPVRTRYSALVQTGHGAHPASYTKISRSFPQVKRPRRGVDLPPDIASMLKKE